jgi:hypothetical protein
MINLATLSENRSMTAVRRAFESIAMCPDNVEIWIEVEAPRWTEGWAHLLEYAEKSFAGLPVETVPELRSRRARRSMAHQGLRTPLMEPLGEDRR